jgi:hypothetical protein
MEIWLKGELSWGILRLCCGELQITGLRDGRVLQ